MDKVYSLPVCPHLASADTHTTNLSHTSVNIFSFICLQNYFIFSTYKHNVIRIDKKYFVFVVYLTVLPLYNVELLDDNKCFCNKHDVG